MFGGTTQGSAPYGSETTVYTPGGGGETTITVTSAGKGAPMIFKTRGRRRL